MKIIIVGNGKVGYAIARQLAVEDHDITIVDDDAAALHRADSTLDVMCVEGNGASISVLDAAGVRGADLVIAVTNLDETNLVCCLIAKKLGAQHTIARVRNPEYRRDAGMLKQAFLSGADFHTVTAARVFHVPQDQVTHQMRSRAKAVNFGIVYGISAFSLSQDIGVTMQEAKEYMDRYFATYTGVKQYMTDVVDKAQEQGYVETLWHRRRALPELKSSNFNMRSFGERVALNMPIQGTAADIIKLAMVRVHSRLDREGLAARLIMQVHDELIVECPEEEAPRVEALLQQEMQGVAELSVPLLAEAHTGRNWLAAKG